jgi:hypothetical protein
MPAFDRAVRVADPDLGLRPGRVYLVASRGGARGDRHRRVHRQPRDVPEDAVPGVHPVVPVDQLSDPRAAIIGDDSADPHRGDPLGAADRRGDQSHHAHQQHRQGKQDQIQPATPAHPLGTTAGQPIQPAAQRDHGGRRNDTDPDIATPGRETAQPAALDLDLTRTAR